MAEYTLEDLLGEIGRSVRSALDGIEQFGLNSFMDHFDEERDDAGSVTGTKPKMVSIPLPKADGTYQAQPVPVAALVNHNSLHLENVNIKFRVQITEAEEGKPLRCALRSSNDKEAGEPDGLSPGMAEIEVNFKRDDPSEGMARTATEFHKTL